MGAGHNHGPAASETGHPGDFRKKLWIAFSITATIVVAQAMGSVITGSLALLTDTAHAITDASGLLVALIAATLMLKPANSKRTWGFRRIEVIAALGQSALLLVVGLSISVAAISATSRPEASVMAWAVSVSSARLPVMTEPMAWATTIVAVIENAIQSFLRKSPGCPVSLAAGP